MTDEFACCENCLYTKLGCTEEPCRDCHDYSNFREREKILPVDFVNSPPHYTQGGIECIDAMEAAFGAQELAVYCKIAAFKYIWRCEHKNGLEDIKKAVWYLNKHIELMERDGD